MLALLATLALPLAATAGQRQQSFQVGAIVTRSARLQIFTAADGSARLRISPGAPVAMQAGEAPVRIESTADSALPRGTTIVTVHY